MLTLKTHCQDILQLSNLPFTELTAKLEQKFKGDLENEEQFHSLLFPLVSQSVTLMNSNY